MSSSSSSRPQKLGRIIINRFTLPDGMSISMGLHRNDTFQKVIDAIDSSHNPHKREIQFYNAAGRRLTIDENPCRFPGDIRIEFKEDNDTDSVTSVTNRNGKRWRDDGCAESSTTNKRCKSDLIDIWRSFVGDPSTSDVCFKVDNGDHIYAHSKILSARLEYFKASLTSGMKESNMVRDKTLKRNVMMIETPDFSYDIMKLMLEFLYTGELEEPDLYSIDICRDLYRISDKYFIAELGTVAITEYRKLLTPQNVIKEVFEFGHLYPELVEQCASVIQLAKKEIDPNDIVKLVTHEAHSNHALMVILQALIQ
ncbi:hypothetical protein BC938DRAFT_483537 [Jimgerdemannia flammicorona]|uniref:BTB domain-containing protein n=1 Tax=Jimgerdemannia flammicorona TaxID=994334 RepID=A0A433R062_9FUNG|nr:hypothetical protein BC938DRAFT_483537 [Jimgerdemannia flammicorona]